MRANAIGFYSIRGNDFIDFQEDSKKDSFKSSLREIRETNKENWGIFGLFDSILTGS